VIERVVYPTGEQLHNECLKYFTSAEQLQFISAEKLPFALRMRSSVWAFLKSVTRFACLLG